MRRQLPQKAAAEGGGGREKWPALLRHHLGQPPGPGRRGARRGGACCGQGRGRSGCSGVCVRAAPTPRASAAVAMVRFCPGQEVAEALPLSWLCPPPHTPSRFSPLSAARAQPQRHQRRLLRPLPQQGRGSPRGGLHRPAEVNAGRAPAGLSGQPSVHPAVAPGGAAPRRCALRLPGCPG